MTEIQLRCPEHHWRLLAKLHDDGPTVIEVACIDCARFHRQAGRRVVRVLHRWSLDGTLVETIIVDQAT